MFDQEQLKELANHLDENNLVVSFYCPLEEEGGVISLKNLISKARAGREEWTASQFKSVDADLTKIEHLVTEERVMSKGGLAVFACSASGLWRVFHLPDKVGPLLVVDHATRMRPLMEWLNRHKQYCTVLVDKGRARIFLLNPTEVEEHSDILHDLPGRHDQGGWAQARYQRHHDDHAMRHLKHTADQTFALWKNKGFERLFVAGTEETVSELVEHLHPYLRDRLAGSFPMEMVSSPKEVLERTLTVASQLREIYDRDAVDNLRGEVHTGNLGAAGLEDTVHALQKGQVLMLLVNEDFTAPGRRCTACDSLCLRDPCPYCGAVTESLDDMVEKVVSRAFIQSCEIRFVAGENKTKLAELGGIGALLRFAG
jgi:peptide chain release factor subunit 1